MAVIIFHRVIVCKHYYGLIENQLNLNDGGLAFQGYKSRP
jgi:hypothetical protein